MKQIKFITQVFIPLLYVTSCDIHKMEGNYRKWKQRNQVCRGQQINCCDIIHHNYAQATNICLHVALLVTTSRKTKNIQCEYYSDFRDRWLPYICTHYMVTWSTDTQCNFYHMSHCFSHVFSIICWHGWVLLALFPGPAQLSVTCSHSRTGRAWEQG